MTTVDDPQYPDLDDLVLHGDVFAFPEARILTVVGSELHQCAVDLPDDATLDIVDSSLHGIDLTGRRIEGLQRVELTGCRLDGARLDEVHLTRARLDGVADLSTIRGATVTGAQAVALAPRLALAAGIRLADAPG